MLNVCNNGYKIRGCIDRGNFVVNLGCSFIGQLVHPVGGEGMGETGWMGSIVVLASCEYHFIRVHKNLMQHPCNNISICAAKLK